MRNGLSVRTSWGRWPAVLAALVVLAFAGSPALHADGTTQALPFSQNWTNTGLITTNDDWSGVPGVMGYRGDGLTPANDVDPRTVLGADSPGVVDVVANIATPNTNSSGGVGEAEITDPVVALQGSGTADAPYVLISVDTTGATGVTISYNVRDIDGSADNSVQQVALHYRIGTSGDFTNVPAGYIADASTGPSLATLVTPISVSLPAWDNQSVVQFRIMTTNATGNDEWVGIDDISITAGAAPTPATMTTPATPGSVLPQPAVFAWTDASADEYFLSVGSSAGWTNYYGGSQGTNLTATVGGIPGDSSDVFVRLWSRFGTSWYHNDYDYVAASGGGSDMANMTTPATPGAVLSQPAAFAWTDPGANEYYLWIGSTPGGYDYYVASQGTNTSASVAGLPTDASDVYVRLFTRWGTAWSWQDYDYVAATGGGDTAQMTTPASNGDTLAQPAQFAWTDASAAEYYLWIGSTVGGYDYFQGSQGTNLTTSVAGLPSNGSPVYVRLWTRFATNWVHRDYNYLAASGGGSDVAVMTTPAANGDTLAGPAVFAWTNVSATEYYLWIGSTPGSYNYYQGSQGTNLTATLGGLPNDGSAVYVRLWTRFSSSWAYRDYNYLARSGGSDTAVMTTPAANGDTLGSPASFAWTDVSAVQYALWIGTSPGNLDLYAQSAGTNTTAEVAGLPAGNVYVRLFTWFGSAWSYNDYYYVAP